MNKLNCDLSKIDWQQYDELTYEGQIGYLYSKKAFGELISRDELRAIVESIGGVKYITQRTTEDCINFVLGKPVDGVNIPKSKLKTFGGKETINKTIEKIGNLVNNDVKIPLPEKEEILKVDIFTEADNNKLLTPSLNIDETEKSLIKLTSIENIDTKLQAPKIQIDKQDEEAIILSLKKIYDYVGKLSEGGRKVGKNNKFGFLNENSEEVISCKYDDADDEFKNGHSMVFLNGKYGFINILLEEIIVCKFKEVLPFIGGIAPVTFGSKWWYINELGTERKEMMFDDVKLPKDGEEYIFILGYDEYKYNSSTKKFDKTFSKKTNVI